MKKSVGGELAACGSVFRDSNHIHRTGKKKMNTTSQPTTDQPNRDRIGIEALTVEPPPGRS